MKFSHSVLTGVALLALILVPAPALAQSSPSAYTSAIRYDVMGRAVGTIAPDPDGSGPLKYAATRTTYDVRGNATKMETGELATWQSETVLPQNWSGFTVLSTAETTYDSSNRKTVSRIKGSNGATTSLTQYSYDNRGRLECTAVRMNPARFNNLPASACSLGVEGANGPDRITRTIYDAAGQILQVRKAVGTPIEIADVTYSYTTSGQIEQVIDANGNRAELRYDGHDRHNRWVFPSKTRPASFNAATPTTALASAGSLNNSDYEAYTFDNNGNRLTLRKRDGSTIQYQFDALNRTTRKDLPTRAGLAGIHRRDVYYSYDLQGRPVRARFSSINGFGQTNYYDSLGRIERIHDNSNGAFGKNLNYQYDLNGNRTQLTQHDGQYIRYEYDGLNRLFRVRQNATLLGTTTYNTRGLSGETVWSYQTSSQNRRTYGYDPVGRLSSIDINLHSTAADVAWNYTRNPASQILSETQSNDTYSWDGHVNVSRNYSTNGLNQYTSAGGANFCYDANGNLTADGASVFLYDIENRLVQKRAQINTNCNSLSYSGTLQAELQYDPLGRLSQVSGGSLGTQVFLHDGNALVAEYNASGTTLRRYAHGSDLEADDPLIWYEGSAQSNGARRYLHADPRGSVIAVTDYRGIKLQTNTYDVFGIPDTASGNDISTKGRFRYTGQVWIPELGMYYYKARIYSPTLGRFLQTDPIGYEDQYNLYAYVGNDPVNATDPTGMRCRLVCPGRPIPLPGFPTSTDQDGNGLDDATEAAAAQLEGAIESLPESVDNWFTDNSVIYRETKDYFFNDDASRAGEDVIGEVPASGEKQVDNRGEGRSVVGVLGEAADAAGVELGETKDGKPTVVFPNGNRATGYPQSETTGGPTIEIRTPKGRVKVKTREDYWDR